MAESQKDCKQSNAYDALFKANVWSLYCGRLTSGGRAGTSTLGSYLPAFYTDKKVRFCAYIKGTATDVEVLTNQLNFKGTTTKSKFNINSSRYGYYCSPYQRIWGATPLQGDVQMLPTKGAVKWINVGGMTLELQ